MRYVLRSYAKLAKMYHKNLGRRFVIMYFWELNGEQGEIKVVFLWENELVNSHKSVLCSGTSDCYSYPYPK
jgi:hypothetical protein